MGIKPTAGVLDLVGSTLHGIEHSTEALDPNARRGIVRSRPPRSLGMDCIGDTDSNGGGGGGGGGGDGGGSGGGGGNTTKTVLGWYSERRVKGSALLLLSPVVSAKPKSRDPSVNKKMLRQRQQKGGKATTGEGGGGGRGAGAEAYLFHVPNMYSVRPPLGKGERELLLI